MKLIARNAENLFMSERIVYNKINNPMTIQDRHWLYAYYKVYSVLIPNNCEKAKELLINQRLLPFPLLQGAERIPNTLAVYPLLLGRLII